MWRTGASPTTNSGPSRSCAASSTPTWASRASCCSGAGGARARSLSAARARAAHRAALEHDHAAVPKAQRRPRHARPAWASWSPRGGSAVYVGWREPPAAIRGCGRPRGPRLVKYEGLPAHEGAPGCERVRGPKAALRAWARGAEAPRRCSGRARALSGTPTSSSSSLERGARHAWLGAAPALRHRWCRCAMLASRQRSADDMTAAAARAHAQAAVPAADAPPASRAQLRGAPSWVVRAAR